MNAEKIDLWGQPHRRFNPLAGEWILVSPHRTQRPWQGQVEKSAVEQRPSYDPTCYLCPGNKRAGSDQNPDYHDVYVFNNDYPALLPDTPVSTYQQEDLLVAASERGIARVVCFSPRHDLTLALMQPPAIRKVVDVWAEQYQELGTLDYVNYVQIFENRGAMMGASNPHPHGQIWAQEHIPNEPAREFITQAEYLANKGSSMLGDYMALEEREGTRVVCQNANWLVVVPFWAIWPFETLVICKQPVGTIVELDEAGRDDLADILRRITVRYDNLFETSFPYSMGFHQTPTDGKSYPAHRLHAHFYPPLLRSATVRKFMVGYEMLGEPQRDITAETSAERLRALSETHF